ncbi:protein of unknown function [Cyanobium sp. NIES-981]|nr:protein of unknown function [Cyanobium sp. NIES-981]
MERQGESQLKAVLHAYGILFKRLIKKLTKITQLSNKVKFSGVVLVDSIQRDKKLCIGPSRERWHQRHARANHPRGAACDEQVPTADGLVASETIQKGTAAFLGS